MGATIAVHRQLLETAVGSASAIAAAAAPLSESKRAATMPVDHRILTSVITAAIAIVGLLTINLYPYTGANSQRPLDSQFHHEATKRPAAIDIEPASFWD
jgi:hypothetical protein